MSASTRPASPPATMSAAEVKGAIRRRHAGAAWVCVEEAFSGYATLGGGIDVLAMGAWRSAKVAGLRACGRRGAVDTRNPIVAYEVKVSRSDFRRELYGYASGVRARSSAYVPPWPGKAQGALERSHYFVFATPRGLLHDDEIQRREPWKTLPRRGALYLPADVGLIEVDGRGCHVRAHATPREAQAWGRHETFELMRRVEYCSRRPTDDEPEATGRQAPLLEEPSITAHRTAAT